MMFVNIHILFNYIKEKLWAVYFDNQKSLYIIFKES